VGAIVGRGFDGAEHRDGQGDLSRLRALAEHPEQFVAAGVAQILNSDVASFADPQAEHAQGATSAWAVSLCRRAALSTAANSSGCSTVRRWPSHGTRGRVTAMVGLVATSSSMTAYLNSPATVDRRRLRVAGA